MPRFVCFLRGVTPQNLKMADLRASLMQAGFAEVRTVLSSGNVVFDAAESDISTIEHFVEAAVQRHVGRTFYAIVRSSNSLQRFLDASPFAPFHISAGEKRVITFARSIPAKGLHLPIEQDGVRILSVSNTEVLTAYTPHPKGPVFMDLIKRTFGSDITTRTLDTVAKCTRS